VEEFSEVGCAKGRASPLLLGPGPRLCDGHRSKVLKNA
jgi:hypothetical protein